ncbi:hypothetical protein Rsub_03103 [Raphidocelis subcapitata]|uniref:Uncharacterized protein n=1 Tax=Raphidocelis subcapitata TaxID=307507 RepID=A0A2V0NVU4_9CHLO|nr:hypothetical protein Rsub_03103 [Raphidocelis subcapitata]|eukprot:GBF90802.1 hypothetical protein Rsub_03103 [Raphidocelis subcapitata]
MLSAARRSLGAFAHKAYALQTAAATRGMAVDGVKGFSEHEQAVENMYFNKEDERLMRRLLGKVKVQAEQDASSAAHHAAAEEAALRQIVGKYKLAEVDIKALMEWKHANY